VQFSTQLRSGPGIALNAYRSNASTDFLFARYFVHRRRVFAVVMATIRQRRKSRVIEEGIAEYLSQKAAKA
jgi:hypothetical protein